MAGRRVGSLRSWRSLSPSPPNYIRISEEITNEADLETGHISEEMTEEEFTNEADLETGHILDEEIMACLSSFSVTVVTKTPGQHQSRCWAFDGGVKWLEIAYYVHLAAFMACKCMSG